MIFRDRIEAAKLLAKQLSRYKGEDGVVLAVPRGGVPLAHLIAKHLGFTLDLVMTKKLGHPHNPEYAVGAVSLEGAVVDKRSDVSKEYVEEETRRIQQMLRQRYQFYRDDEPPVDLKNKIVIIVDDGIATGKTILSTIHIIRKQNPKWIIVAVPVAPPSTAKKIQEEADEFVCLSTPKNFIGVGQFYEDFTPVEDEEVIRLLHEVNHSEHEEPVHS